MVEVQQFKSEKFTSNVYSIRSFSSPEVYLVDCGGFSAVQASISSDQKIAGIFLTHYHYDHMYFLSQWIAAYPDLMVWGAQETLEGLADSKRNLSFYHEDPVVALAPRASVVHDQEIIRLFNETVPVKAYETEGHCEGSLTFAVDRYLFTGDSLIPNIATVTKLKTGNKERSKTSLRKINALCTPEAIICPGHLDMIAFQDVNWSLYL